MAHDKIHPGSQPWGQAGVGSRGRPRNFLIKTTTRDLPWPRALVPLSAVRSIFLASRSFDDDVGNSAEEATEAGNRNDLLDTRFSSTRACVDQPLNREVLCCSCFKVDINLFNYDRKPMSLSREKENSED